MNKYLKFFLLLLLTIGANFSIKAQTVTAIRLSVSDSVKTNMPKSVTSLSNNTITPEAIPTPETQGFIKYINENGKTVYRKTQPNFTIDYTPNK